MNCSNFFPMDFSLLIVRYIVIHICYTRAYFNFKKLFLDEDITHLFNYLTRPSKCVSFASRILLQFCPALAPLFPLYPFRFFSSHPVVSVTTYLRPSSFFRLNFQWYSLLYRSFNVLYIPRPASSIEFWYFAEVL